jgi:hypothetical protein
MGRVDSGALKLKDAAAMLELSYRQAKRLWRCYRQVGGKGLQHGNAGRPSNRSKPLKLRRRVLNLIKKKYSGSEEERFGPTLASEHLAEEDGIAIDHETLRCWMLAEGLWSRQRRRKKHCQRRERKSHFGELVQLDGSFHDWLEQRGPRGCLMDMVDDATGKVQARMGMEETIWAAVDVLRAWIRNYGIPRALYTDWKNVYKQKATPAEQLRGEVPVTQFGGMCQKLGIRIIAASSPQAKGRVERINGVHQDRLIKKMRRKGIGRPESLSRAVFPDRPDWAQCWKVFWHGLQPSLPQRLKRRFRVDVYSSLAKTISVHSPLSHTCGYLTSTAAKWFTPQNEDRSDTLAQFMVSLWPEERSFEADRKVSSSAQTRPLPQWNPCIGSMPLKSVPREPSRRTGQ